MAIANLVLNGSETGTVQAHTDASSLQRAVINAGTRATP
jgi:hypothetical protein